MPAFYSARFAEQNSTSAAEIVGQLSLTYKNHYQNQKKDLTRSWEYTVPFMQRLYRQSAIRITDLSDWRILYEYPIPRRSKRIDVVLLSPRVVYVIEIKMGANDFSPADDRQVRNYCLDLRDFQIASESRVIVPILLCTHAQARTNRLGSRASGVTDTQFANPETLPSILETADSVFSDLPSDLDAVSWESSPYMPTPTIIEAAQVMYSDKTVTAIARSHAGSDNLGVTQAAVLDAIAKARKDGSKAICFITGVPGAGKTLAGLNIVHGRDFKTEDKDLGIFLSGNSPLVKVLSEALAVDFAEREGVDRAEARRQVSTFITNVHAFIDDYYANPTKIQAGDGGEIEKSKKLPPERVLIYDEAQRAWTAEHKARKSYGAITESEPNILLSIMSRFSGWAVIVCLVGGGQEINTGEAGLREWGRSVEDKFPDWTVYVSSNLKEGDHSTGHRTLFDTTPTHLKICEDSRLHLTVGIRAPRAKGISEWVAAVLNNDVATAQRLLSEELDRYPISVTRSLENAKQRLREEEVDKVRTGIIASSGGRRLRAVGPDPYFGLRGDSSQQVLGAWYLNSPNDVRSSNFLEVVATEYAVQGLEIDWAAVLWDADLRKIGGEWVCRSFVGTRWQNVNEQQRQYTINKYRVLLTRAREGMVIFVPEGNPEDVTRLPEFYDGTFEYLRCIGVPEI